jgi:hypothetical protein
MRGKWGLHLALVGANAYLAIKHVNAHVYVRFDRLARCLIGDLMGISYLR